MSSVKKISKLKDVDILNDIILILMLVLLFFAPFLRGLYFEEELHFFHMSSSILACLWFVKQLLKKEKIELSKSDIPLFLLALLYGGSVFWSISTRGGLIAAIKMINVMLVFLVIRSITLDIKNRNLTIHVLIVSGIVGFGSVMLNT